MNFIHNIIKSGDIWGAPDGALSLVLADAARTQESVIFVARDDARLTTVKAGLKCVNATLDIWVLPAWDCLPFDRLSPNGGLVGQRIETLARLCAGETPSILLTTINAMVQKLPPPDYFTDSYLVITPASAHSPASLAEFLSNHAYLRTDTVRETGEFAIRGGIVDVFPPGQSDPVRLDFFGDEIETMRVFDAATQRSTGRLDRLILRPVSEFVLTEASISRFRTGYLQAFGGSANRDALYESVSAGRMHPGIEHWLPLFHDRLTTLVDYCPDWPLFLDHEGDAAYAARQAQIQDFFEARNQHDKDDEAAPYRPLPPDQLYLSDEHIQNVLLGPSTRRFFAFSAPETAGPNSSMHGKSDAGGRAGIRLATSDAASAVTDCVAAITAERQEKNRPVVLACSSGGASSRLTDLLENQIGAGVVQPVSTLTEVRHAGVYVTQWPLETGFQTDHILVFAEPDIFGQRL